MIEDSEVPAWELVPAEAVYETFHHVVRPSGFRAISNGVLARPVTDDISHLIKLVAYKGGEYHFRWGASLAYVPHSWNNALRWHRTSKSFKA